MRKPIPLQNFALRRVRVACGWRIGDLAAVAGVSLTSLLEIETGRTFLAQERLTRYVLMMGVPIAGLIAMQEALAQLRLALRP